MYRNYSLCLCFFFYFFLVLPVSTRTFPVLFSLSSSFSFYFLSCSHFISTNIIRRGGSRKRWKKKIIRATEDRKATLPRKRGKESIGLIWLRLRSPLDNDSCTHVYILHTYMQMYVYMYICTLGNKTSGPSVHSNGPHPVINKVKFAATALNRIARMNAYRDKQRKVVRKGS